MIYTPLLEAAAYPHPVSEPIQTLQTHISTIYLTGEFAYKVKKPVNFGFLDFSTLDKRLFFCQEELRLNCRAAAGLYLEVVPLVETETGVAIGEAGQTGIDYALKMRQFPQVDLLSERFARGEVTAADCEAIAILLAQLHASAQTDATITAFGDVATIKQTADDNYAHTMKYVGLAQTEPQLVATRAYSDRIFSEQATWFSERQAQGKIKECHGDLHLGNICLFEDAIQLFDCIEFNQEFRNIDVIYDAAFLVMDLSFRGRPDLANRFLNTYLERTNDYLAARLLPVYLSMRAYVRAKVTSFLLDDPGIDAVTRDKAQETARAYYTLAYRYTQPKPPQIILICGLSGSGKSTLGRRVAAELDAIQIRSDAVRKHLGGVALDQRGDASLYSAEMTEKTYQRLCDLAMALTQAGQSVVLDAKYDRVAWRQQVLEAAAAQGIPVRILHCQASEATLRTRLEKRQGDIADATADLVSSQQAQWEALTEAEQSLAIAIDTEHDLDSFTLL